MSDQPELPPKKDVARALLLRGSVFVHLNPRDEEVAVPPWLRKQAQLVLQIGLELPVPIVDLQVDDLGVFATLSFNRSPYPCTIPWSAVFGLMGEDGKGMVWPEDMPEEIQAEMRTQAAVEKNTPRARGHLRAVGSPSEEEDIETPPAAEDSAPNGGIESSPGTAQPDELPAEAAQPDELPAGTAQPDDAPEPMRAVRALRAVRSTLNSALVEVEAEPEADEEGTEPPQAQSDNNEDGANDRPRPSTGTRGSRVKLPDYLKVIK